MMTPLTKNELKFIKEHIVTIETIVKNASCSSMTTAFRMGIIAIAKNHGQINCDHCNNELYLAITRIYGLYLEQINKKK